MQVNSIKTFFQSENNKQKTISIGAPAILAGVTTFVASRAPKDCPDAIKDSFKFTKKLSKSAKAAGAAAVIMAVLTLKKDDITAIGNKIKSLFNKKDESKTVGEQNVNAEAVIAEEVVAETKDADANAVNNAVVQPGAANLLSGANNVLALPPAQGQV